MKTLFDQIEINEQVEGNMPLVHHMIKLFARKRYFQLNYKHPDYDDAFQIGCMALMKSAQGFDPSRGWKFSTYAARSIWNSLSRWHELEVRQGFTFIDQNRMKKSELCRWEEQDMEVADPHDDYSVVDDQDYSQQLSEKLSEAMASLPAQQMRILQARFFERLNLCDTGARHGVCKERARQIQKLATTNLANMVPELESYLEGASA